MTNDRAELHYAPPVPWHARKRLARLLLVGTLTLIVIATIWWGPAVWERAQHLYWQQQCAGFEFADGAVVYDTNPSAVVTPPPAAWLKLRAAVLPTRRSAAATIYVHRHRRPDGLERLVALELTDMPGAWSEKWLKAEFIVPGNLLTRPAPPLRSLILHQPKFLGPTIETGTLRIFGGHPDPSDATHFTFDYETERSRGTVDAWLTDQDQLQFELRPTPAEATPPPPTSQATLR